MKHGFTNQYQHEWRTSYGNESKYLRYAKVKKRQPYEAGDEIDKVREPYLKKWKELVQVRYRIRELEKAKAKAITTSVWD